MTTPLLNYRDTGTGIRVDLDRFIASRALVQANSGGGKSRSLRYLLERWELGGRVFHRPDCEVWGSGWKVTIEGLIRHHGVSYGTSKEAWLWLAFLFAPRIWARVIGLSRSLGWQWRPMIALQVVVFEIRVKIHWSRCRRCARTWFSGFDRSLHFYCPGCRQHLWNYVDSDLPF